MLILSLSKKTFSFFPSNKLTLFGAGLLGVINSIILIRELWNATPAFSFWVAIVFFMTASTACTINFIFVAVLANNSDN